MQNLTEYIVINKGTIFQPICLTPLLINCFSMVPKVASQMHCSLALFTSLTLTLGRHQLFRPPSHLLANSYLPSLPDESTASTGDHYFHTVKCITNKYSSIILMFTYSHLLCVLQQKKSQQIHPDHAEKARTMQYRQSN